MTLGAALEARDLSITVGGRQLLRDAAFDLKPGQLTVLIGISGGGKSTLLRVLSGLEHPGQPNQIQWRGEVRWSPADAVKHIGLVFQQPALLDELSAIANVRLAIDHRRIRKSSDEAFVRTPQAEAHYWLNYLHVPTGVRVSQLSGGQRQRLSLAQTLAGKPGVLFYDEPTTGLDSVAASRVAKLIRQTQQEQGITSIVVTHDYESFLSVADHVLVIDTIDLTIATIESASIESVREEMLRQTAALSQKSLASSPTAAQNPVRKFDFFATLVSSVGNALEWIGSWFEWLLLGLISIVPRWRHMSWGVAFFVHFARLVFGGTAIIYLAIAGSIIGFVSTYFTLKYMPYKVYTEPLLTEELLGAMGFALYRIFIPVLASILVAARCAAAVSADLGNKRYGGQFEAMQLLGVSPLRYWLSSVVWSFGIGIVILTQTAFLSAKWTSLAVYLAMQPETDASYWDIYFHQPIRLDGTWLYIGFWWGLGKLLCCGFGTAVITYALAVRPKLAASDVSRTITTTILWSTLWVLMVHLIVALVEFRT